MLRRTCSFFACTRYYKSSPIYEQRKYNAVPVKIFSAVRSISNTQNVLCNR